MKKLALALSLALGGVVAFAAENYDARLKELWSQFQAANREKRPADAKAAIVEWTKVCRAKIDAMAVPTEGTPQAIAKARMAKCGAILELASRYNDQLKDEKKALAAIDEALAMRDGDVATRVAALCRKASFMDKHKRAAESLPFAEEALKLALANPELKLQRSAYIGVGQSHYANKRWEQAIEAFVTAAGFGNPVQVPSEIYEAVLWVTRAGRGDDARKHLERIRAIPNLHINNYTRTYEIDARTYNAEKRFDESLKLYDRVLADTNILARADVPNLVITAARLVKGCGKGYAASFAFYDKVFADPKKYNLDEKGLWKVADSYIGCCWRSMDRQRIKGALKLAKDLGHEQTTGMAPLLDRYYDEMDAFPRDEKDIVIPKDARDLGFDPDRKVVKASSFGWNPTNATECLQNALDSDASTVIVDAMPGPWYIWSISLKPGPCSNRKIVFAKGVTVLSAPEAKEKDQPGWYRRDMFHFSSCTNLWIEGEGELGKDVYIGKYRNRKERFAAGFEYGGNGFSGSCRNTVLKNLWIANCGQDSLCWGGKNSFVIDCIFDDNYRQGMSLGGGENNVYKNVTFCNTFGGEPHCGIDFEPYYEIYSTPHHYFFDCRFYNNASKNVIFATSTYAPMTAYFKRCQFEAQRNGNIAVLARAGIYMDAFCHAPSKIIFDECRIDGYSDGYGNPIQFLSTFLYDVTFRNCVINDKGCLLKGEKETASPIHLILDRAVYDGYYPNAGVVTFDNVKVNGYDNVPLVQVTDKNGKYGINTFRGTIDWNGKQVDMSKYSYLPADRDLVDAAEADPTKLVAPAGSAVPWEPSFTLPFGHTYYNPLPQYTLLCRGEKGKTAEFVVRYHCKIRADKPIRVTGPDGKTAEVLWPKTGDNEVAYAFPADGVYSFDFNVPSQLGDDEEAREGFSILSVKGTHPAWQAGKTRLGRVAGIRTGDDYPSYVGYFEMPAGKDCMVKLQGGGIEVRNAAGESVFRLAEDEYSGSKCFTLRNESGKSEIWSFTALGKGLTVKFFDPLPGIWADDPAWLPTYGGANLAYRRVKRGNSSAAEMPKAVLLPLPLGKKVAAAVDKAVAARDEFAKGDVWAKKYREARYHYDWMEPAMQTKADLQAMAAELDSLEPIRKMRDMEAAAKRESDDLRRYVAFVATYAPVLALDDDAAKDWVDDLEEPDDDDGFGDRVNAAIERFGLEWTEDGIYYADYAGILKVVPFIVQRLNALGLNK